MCVELAWLTRLLHDFGIDDVSLIPLKCENQTAIDIARNLVFRRRTNHINIDCPFVREKLQASLILVSHVSTTNQFADALTKELHGSTHQEAIINLGLQSDPLA